MNLRVRSSSVVPGAHEVLADAPILMPAGLAAVFLNTVASCGSAVTIPIMIGFATAVSTFPRAGP
jgi:hypothetical protein